MKNDKMKLKKEVKASRRRRIRAKVSGTADRPRLSVFRSLKHISAQLINDATGQTILLVTDKDLKGKKAAKAKEVGKLVAKLALAKKVKQVVFDRGGNQYHGRVQALAEGAREGGLEF